MGVGLGLLQIAIALAPHSTKPTQAAEHITFSLGATIERTISVESLEIYAKEGRLTDELAPYAGYLKNVDPEALDAAQGPGYRAAKALEGPRFCRQRMMKPD